MVSSIVVSGIVVSSVVVSNVVVSSIVVSSLVVSSVVVISIKYLEHSREPGLESSCCHFKAWAISFTPRCFSSPSCVNEYLLIGRGGYK